MMYGVSALHKEGRPAATEKQNRSNGEAHCGSKPEDPQVSAKASEGTRLLSWMANS